MLSDRILNFIYIIGFLIMFVFYLNNENWHAALWIILAGTGMWVADRSIILLGSALKKEYTTNIKMVKLIDEYNKQCLELANKVEKIGDRLKGDN